MNNKAIGVNIRKARKEKGMTQKELGAAILRTESSIAKYEQGLVDIPNNVLSSIAAILGVSFFDLLGQEERAIYESGLKDGAKAEGWLNSTVDELWKQEGYFYSDEEVRLINSFSQLNDDGQKKVADLAEDLAGNPKYQRQAPPEEGTTPAAESQASDTADKEKASLTYAARKSDRPHMSTGPDTEGEI